MWSISISIVASRVEIEYTVRELRVVQGSRVHGIAAVASARIMAVQCEAVQRKRSRLNGAVRWQQVQERRVVHGSSLKEAPHRATAPE